MKKTSTYTVIGILGGVALLLPLSVFAAQTTFQVVPSSTKGDEAAVVEARFDPEGQGINAVEGVVSFGGAGAASISSVIVETGGSLLTLWPLAPEYEAQERVIRFTGGSAQGFTKEGGLFRMRIFMSQPGEVELSWIGGTAYLNDGQGTKEPVTARSLTMALTRSTPNQINASSADSNPPYFDAIEIGHDPSVFDGKYFLSFHATDDISGVAEYEVIEGQESTRVSNGIYVLKDQTRDTDVFITAYDRTGNSKTVRVPTGIHWIVWVIGLLLVVAILAVGQYVYSTYFKQ